MSDILNAAYMAFEFLFSLDPVPLRIGALSLAVSLAASAAALLVGLR